MAATDAINYSDDDHKASLESEEVSDISVASSNDSDKDSNDDDNEDGDTKAAVFLRNARDIQNRMSQCMGTATVDDRQFRSLFGACIEIILKVWLMLWEDGLRPKRASQSIYFSHSIF